MDKHNFKKKFGQNFLTDKNIISNIVSSINTNSNDLIIEIGPGNGALTSLLIKKDSYLLCYEIDKDLEENLIKLKNNKTDIIFDDFLKSDINEDIKNIKFDKLYIIGNLPYYITTPIILKIIESNIDVEEMVVMVQKEVADRFSAQAGTREYGSISVLLNYFFDITKLFDVNRNKFYPIPNVDSSVIKLSKKKNIMSVDFNKFNKLVKDAFQFKRKNIRNNLKSYNLEKINKILNKYNYSISNRAEELSYEIFVELANNL